MKKYNFTVLIEEDKESGGYTAVVPALKSCYTEAETIEELMENVKEVIELCLEEEKEEAGFPASSAFKFTCH